MATASVWDSVKQTNISSLEDVMSEQMAVDLQNKENHLAGLAPVSAASAAVPSLVELVPQQQQPDISSDLLLAQYLQEQFDKECDERLKHEEHKFNGDSKVSVSFRNFRLRSQEYPIFESDPEDDRDYDDDADRTREWDSFESREREAPQIPRCGYTVHEDRMVTKHDRQIAGRRNACKMMDLPPNVRTGDGGGFDMELNSGVLNTLRKHARTDNQRKHRVVDKEDRSTSQALDRATRLTVLRLTNSGAIEALGGPISAGKEAFVFHAHGGDSEELEVPVPAHCVLKVYKTTLNEFKTREKYIKADMRFQDRISRQNPRKLIHLWAEKELCNLKRLSRAKIRCPQPLVLKQHVLLMSLIGEDGRPAPKLKDVTLTDRQWREAYTQVTEMMRQMYDQCSLVHADLSEYNILYHAGFCWLIDVGQAVEPFHPEALTFLYRDCGNVTTFFRSKQVDVLSAEELFTSVSGLPLKPENTTEQLAALEKAEQPRRRGQHRSEEVALQQWLELHD